MAAGSLFQWGEISGFYTRLVVAQAEVSAAVSVICWDLDPCQLKKKFFLWAAGLKKLFNSFPFSSCTNNAFPFWGTLLWISPSLSPQDAWVSITGKAFSLAQSAQKLKSISGIFCQIGILRRLMTNKIHWLILNRSNQHFINRSFLV